MKRHTISWSDRAREIADMQAEYVNSGWATISDVIKLLNNLEENPLIKNKAAKRFGKLVRAGKVIENIELYNSRFN